MDRHGRQRLLKGRACHAVAPGAKAGQAALEILPALLIFIMVISACIRYFEIFRGAVEQEQVARNLIFAKIDNSGTLTTPAGQLANSAQSSPADKSTQPVQMDIEGSVRAPVISNNVFVSQEEGCFSVFPPLWQKTEDTNGIFAMGQQGAFPSVKLVTYSVIYRKASGARCPF